MIIDITSLNNSSKNYMDIDSSFTIPNECFNNIDIISLKDLNIKGVVEKLDISFITIKAIVSGVMIIPDSISLEPIEYNFECEIDEEIENFDEKSSNLLDITDILWQNIILEVPLKLSNVENFNDYQGDGWKLVSEDSIETNTNNPFKELKDMMGEE